MQLIAINDVLSMHCAPGSNAWTRLSDQAIPGSKCNLGWKDSRSTKRLKAMSFANLPLKRSSVA